MPNHYVIGARPDGRSHVAEHVVTSEGAASLTNVPLWDVPVVPPPAPGRGPGDIIRDLGVSPVGARWISVWMKPEHRSETHRTDTLDCDVVVQGEVTLGLDEGEVLLRVADTVVIPGLRHSWTPGPEGVLMSLVLFGLPDRGPAGPS